MGKDDGGKLDCVVYSNCVFMLMDYRFVGGCRFRYLGVRILNVGTLVFLVLLVLGVMLMGIRYKFSVVMYFFRWIDLNL